MEKFKEGNEMHLGLESYKQKYLAEKAEKLMLRDQVEQLKKKVLAMETALDENRAIRIRIGRL